jgi:hypothetical protein
MNALDAISERAQPGYEKAATNIATAFRNMFGAEPFEGVDLGDLAETAARLLEAQPLDVTTSHSAVVAHFMTILEWCCGVTVGNDVKRRLFALLRRDYRAQFEHAGLKRSKPDVAARRSHVVFTGSLGSPLHSPSIGAAGYLKALAADPKNRRIEVFHYGAIHPDLGALMAEQLPPWVRFHQIEQTPDYLSQAVLGGPSAYHFWCYPRTNVTFSFMAMHGPTLMFTCADDPPEQYADVYWSCRKADHVHKVWGAAAPEGFRANFETCKAADFKIMPATNVRTKAMLGMGPDELLVACIGNRLSVDLDEAFVNGVERALRSRPHVRWLIVGALPDWLSNAMRQVLGPRFLHITFEPDLAGLMQAADLYLNPFRRGGGNSAIIAAHSGAPVLTRSDIGEVAAIAPPHHSVVGEAAYFARLDELLDDAALRATWAAEQKAWLDAWLDPRLYCSELDRMVALAFQRFKARSSRSMEVVFPDAPPLAAPAAA